MALPPGRLLARPLPLPVSGSRSWCSDPSRSQQQLHESLQSARLFGFWLRNCYRRIRRLRVGLRDLQLLPFSMAGTGGTAALCTVCCWCSHPSKAVGYQYLHKSPGPPGRKPVCIMPLSILVAPESRDIPVVDLRVSGHPVRRRCTFTEYRIYCRCTFTHYSDRAATPARRARPPPVSGRPPAAEQRACARRPRAPRAAPGIRAAVSLHAARARARDAELLSRSRCPRVTPWPCSLVPRCGEVLHAHAPHVDCGSGPAPAPAPLVTSGRAIGALLGGRGALALVWGTGAQGTSDDLDGPLATLGAASYQETMLPCATSCTCRRGERGAQPRWNTAAAVEPVAPLEGEPPAAAEALAIVASLQDIYDRLGRVQEETTSQR